MLPLCVCVCVYVHLRGVCGPAWLRFAVETSFVFESIWSPPLSSSGRYGTLWHLRGSPLVPNTWEAQLTGCSALEPL